MKTKIMGVITIVLVLGFAGMANATIVQLDLFDLGCPTEFNWDTGYWTTNFDLGVVFTDISHVYIDWSGEIAPMVLYPTGSPPLPLDVGIDIYFGSNPFNWRSTWISGGKATYPAPEPFNLLSEFVNGPMPWSVLFDGQGTITVRYMTPIMLSAGVFGKDMEYGSVTLNSATLVFDGVVVPEPATLFLVGMGMILVRIGTRRKSRSIRI